MEVVSIYVGVGIYEVHRPNCRDIARALRKNPEAYPERITIPDGEDVEGYVNAYECEDFGSDYGLTGAEYVKQYGGEDIRVMPCVDG